MARLLHRRDLLKTGLAMPALAIAPPGSGSTGMTRRAGRLYGGAVRAATLTADASLRRQVIDDYDWFTPEIDFKWNALEYRRGEWWFDRADRLVDFARVTGKLLRGHTLLWDQSTPDWVKADLAEHRDWHLVDRWFTTALGRYGDAACEWDVVNEPIDTEHGDRDLRRTCFQRAFGSEYIGRALRLARERAPTTKLMINEYGLDYTNAIERDRRSALLRLVEGLRRDGVPLDGIGIQAHLDLAKGPLDTQAITIMLREIADMGLTISITELDVREADRSRPLAERDRAVADEVRRYLDVVLAEPKVRGVVCWGVSDRDSWLQNDIAKMTPGGLNRGLPLDESLRRKPVYWALREGIAAHQV